MHSIQVGPSWTDPLVSFLKQGLLPKDRGEAEKIHRKALWYWLSEEQKLYKRSHLKELHERIYGSHTGGKFLSHRALT